MKKLFVTALALLVCASYDVSAQVAKDIAKEHKEILKITKSELYAKASKTARTEAKKLSKAGWKVSPGVLPLEKQLERAYYMQMEHDENMLPKYLMSEGLAVGEVYDTAKAQALELAKTSLAGQLDLEITNLAKLRFIPIVECYRDIKKNKEVLIRLAYKKAAANATNKSASQKSE